MLRRSNLRRRLDWRGYRYLFCLACAVGLLVAQPEGGRVTFYTAQTTYSLALRERNGIDYVGLFEALEPVGAVSAKVEGKKWKLTFRNLDSHFEAGKTKAKVHGASLDLSSVFLLENGRGYVPIASLKTLLPLLMSGTVDVHQDSHRVFIGVAPVKVTARKTDAGSVSFTFSAPVNPQIATEPGKLRMSFLREPLVSDTPSVTFDDKTVTRALYREANGIAELTVVASAPVQAGFSDDRKTITVAALPPAQPPQQSASPTTAAAPVTVQAQAVPAKPRPHPAVVIDAAHGGDDPGAKLAQNINEKDVTLALARRLKHELELRGIEAALLRDSDASISLDQRVSAANLSGAALYVVIHATASGSGIHLYTAMVPSQPRKTFAFVRVRSAQAPSIDISRALVSAISTELLKRDTPVTSMMAAVPPLNLVLPPAIAVEIAPPPSLSGHDLASPEYQQTAAVVLATGIAAAHARLAQQEASR